MLHRFAEPVESLLRTLARSSRSRVPKARLIVSFSAASSALTSGEHDPSCSEDLPRMLTAAGVKTTVLVGLEPDRHPAFLAAGQAGRLDVYFCNDGRAALELAKSVQVDAWVIASVLPDMVGLRLRSILEHRRRAAAASPGVQGMPSLPSASRAPVTFLIAARHDEGEERRALETGVHGYLIDNGLHCLARTSPTPAADDCEAHVSPTVTLHKSQRRNQSPPRTRGSPAGTPPVGYLVKRKLAFLRPSMPGG